MSEEHDFIDTNKYFLPVGDCSIVVCDIKNNFHWLNIKIKENTAIFDITNNLKFLGLTLTSIRNINDKVTKYNDRELK